MSCPKPYDLTAFVKGELSDAERVAAAAHVGSCDVCSKESDAIRKLLASIRGIERIEPSADFAERVREAYVAAHPESVTKHEAKPDLVAYLKGETAPAEREEIHFHLETCGSCKKERVRVQALLAQLQGIEQIEASPKFNERVCDAFVAAHPEFARETAWEALRRQPVWLRSVAAILVVALSAYLVLGTQKPATDEPVVLNHPKVNRVAPTFDSGTSRNLPKPVDPVEADAQAEAEQTAGVRGSHSTEPNVPTSMHGMDRPAHGDKFVAFRPNRGTDKKMRATEFGGEDVAVPLRKALTWLSKSQSAKGNWDPVTLGGEKQFEVGITGLATLAFLGDGHTPSNGEFALSVKKAIAFLIGQQQPNGLIGDAKDPKCNYNHAVAALALVECYIMTERDPSLQPAVKGAIDYAVKSQNKTGGWDYVAGGPGNDTSIGGWMVLVLRLGLESGDTSVEGALGAANERILAMTARDGKVGYRKPDAYPNFPFSTTAVGMLSYMLSTPLPDAALVEKQAQIVLEGLKTHPVTTAQKDFASRDLYFWYFGSLALHQQASHPWEIWNRAIKGKLIGAQGADGSWGAMYDRWSTSGGQAYTTSMGALILSTYWRYPKLVQ